jgi:PIN domain nuclease of toxin-antitoxin system
VVSVRRLWFLSDDPNLSESAKTLIQDEANRKYVSIASCWEIAIKSSRGKLKLAEPAGTLLDRELQRNGFDLLPISLRHATHVEALPDHHRDPFDRLLIAQSQLEGFPIISIDGQLDAYGVVRFW